MNAARFLAVSIPVCSLLSPRSARSRPRPADADLHLRRLRQSHRHGAHRRPFVFVPSQQHDEPPDRHRHHLRRRRQPTNWQGPTDSEPSAFVYDDVSMPKILAVATGNTTYPNHLIRYVYTADDERLWIADTVSTTTTSHWTFMLEISTPASEMEVQGLHRELPPEKCDLSLSIAGPQAFHLNRHTEGLNHGGSTYAVIFTTRGHRSPYRGPKITSCRCPARLLSNCSASAGHTLN